MNVGDTCEAQWAPGGPFEPVRVIGRRGGWPPITVESRPAMGDMPAVGGADATALFLAEFTPALDVSPRKRGRLCSQRGPTWRL